MSDDIRTKAQAVLKAAVTGPVSYDETSYEHAEALARHVLEQDDRLTTALRHAMFQREVMRDWLASDAAIATVTAALDDDVTQAPVLREDARRVLAALIGSLPDGVA